MSRRPHQTKQPSVTALSSRAIFMFRWIWLSFIRKTHALSSLFSNCHVKKLTCFYDPQFGRILLNISLSDSVLETKKTLGKRVEFDMKKYFSWQTIADAEPWWFENFDGLTFLTALFLFNRSDYLNYCKKDSDKLTIMCLMRVQSMVTTLLFALQIKFVLKVESNAWGI